MKKKSHKNSQKVFRGLSVLEQVKAARKESRKEEIKLHGKPLNISNISLSKKIYNRKRLNKNFGTKE